VSTERKIYVILTTVYLTLLLVIQRGGDVTVTVIPT
jgi:hypothetical protein